MKKLSGKIKYCSELQEGHFYKFLRNGKEISMEYLGTNEYQDNIFLDREYKTTVEFSKNSFHASPEEDVDYELLDNCLYKYWEITQTGDEMNPKLKVSCGGYSRETSINFSNIIEECLRQLHG